MKSCIDPSFPGLDKLSYPAFPGKKNDYNTFWGKKLFVLFVKILTNLYFRTHLRKISRLNADSGYPTHSDSESQVRLNSRYNIYYFH